MPPMKKQKRMPATTDGQTKCRRSKGESGSVAETQEATEGDGKQETPTEVTQEGTMEATEEAILEATREATMEVTQDLGYYYEGYI